MKTPSGKECTYYYQDFHRGRNVQQCRLVEQNLDSDRWHPKDCTGCRVPDILLANADPNMELQITIKKGFLGFGRRVQILATDRRDGQVIEDPFVGRPDETNPGLELFRRALEETDND